MTESKKSVEKCPTCGAPAADQAPPGGRSPRPFCSSRCADVDLGRWFGGQYAIPAVDAADDTIVDALLIATQNRDEDQQD
ncbi:DNA gyrase inhibitor YacG [Alphaproteobacteria bacterium]|nr:DNA gyrase inhibitor YacG [Alphaproteobacteria bacterium]